MNKIKGLIFPTFIILGLIVMPRVALTMVPVDMVSMIYAMDLVDLDLILNALMIFGIILAILSALKNLTEKWTTTNLASGITSAIIWFILSLFLWGAGDLWSFGEISRTLNVMKNVTASFVLNLRFFVLLQAGVSLLGILNIILTYAKARDRRRAQPEAYSHGAEPSEGLESGLRQS